MAIPRQDIQRETVYYGIPLTAWRQADIAAMGISGTAGDHFIDEATNVLVLKGNTPSSSTVTDISWAQFVLPHEYMPGDTVTFQVAASVDATADTNTIDLSVFRANRTTGAVGSDICATAVQNTTATDTLFEFTITPTTLGPGDILNLKLTTVNTDADGTDGIVDIWSTGFLLAVRG